jgi:O-antigen ligase
VLRAHVVLLVLAMFAASVYGIEFVLEQGGTLPRSLFPDLFADQGVGFYDGFVELRLPSLAILPFALPFLVAAAVCWGGKHSILRRRWVWPALFAALMLALLSGRRAVQLVMGLAPFVTLGLFVLMPRQDRRELRKPLLVLLGGLVVAAVACAVFLAHSYGFDGRIMWDEFRQGFDPTASLSSSIRAVQLHELVRGWEANPLFGGGHGAFVREHVRDPGRPWSYELSYPTLLFQTGIVGVLMYGALLFWLFHHAIRMIRSGGQPARTMLPIAVGLICFLIANATNPYLLKFDFMWTVFLPLALVNRWLVEREEAARA